MGVFDVFIDKTAQCPRCYANLEDIQSKAFESESNMLTYNIGDKVNTHLFVLTDALGECHTSCPKCAAWVAGWVKIKNNKYLGVTGLKVRVEKRL